MESTFTTPYINRLGFHYFPDTVHYRESDLATWLPELQALAASWLVLQAPLNRAIPEAFIRRLISHNIQPVLHYHFPPSQPPSLDDFGLLTRTYARWGVRYVVLFDRPNCRANWPVTAWAQNNLVERFIDVFQPLALTAIHAGLIPIFPPLVPGGDYWDTAFLRASLESLLRRNQPSLLDRMALSGYANPNGRPLNWGSGGPERWPASRPYDTPKGSEDQRGFRVFDWYLAIAEAVLGDRCPMFLMDQGYPSEIIDPSVTMPIDPYSTQNLLIARLLMGEKLTLDPVPGEVLAYNFGPISTDISSPVAPFAWFHPAGSHQPDVAALQHWASTHHWTHSIISQAAHLRPVEPTSNRTIIHYLLLPNTEESGYSYQLDLVRSFIAKYHPTIGFSPSEAAHARRVTVLGTHEQVPDSILDGLVTAGCLVDDLRGDGMTIATKLTTIQ